MKKKARLENINDGLERATRPTGQPQAAPFPAAQQAAPYFLPNAGLYTVSSNGMPLGLPKYSSVDEYGRIYNPLMTYGPQPHSGPVPIATPPQIVQLTPIVSPVAFVPYSTQNQGLYQYDEDED